jgi:hypothetical protein
MEFIETVTFTRLIKSLLNDEEYRALQNAVLERPDQAYAFLECAGCVKPASVLGHVANAADYAFGTFT